MAPSFGVPTRPSWLFCGAVALATIVITFWLIKPSSPRPWNECGRAWSQRMQGLSQSTEDMAMKKLLQSSNALASTYHPASAVTPFPASFWFVKNVKVGGSSLAGVMRALCAHYGIACINPPSSDTGNRIGWKTEDEIKAAASAAYAVGFEHVAVANHGAYIPSAMRHLGKPMMFTMVRHPVGRTLSAYFYNLLGSHRSHEGAPLEEGRKCLEALRSGRHCALLDGFEEHYVHGDGTFGRNHIFKYTAGDAKTAAAAFDRYDFVFVTERFDESLVVFMLTYGLTLRDVAYLRMKDRNGTYPKQPDMPTSAVNFIIERNELDMELWELAMAALDNRIAALKAEGHDFDGLMARFAAMQAVVQRECAEYEKWYEDHGFDTMLTYWGKDNGAGNRCIASAVRLAGYG